MNIRNLGLFFLLGGLLMSPVHLCAQAEQTPERLLDDDETEQVDETPEAEPVLPPASNEVDVSESHFRRSMELRDEQLQRSPDLTTGSYSRGTGLQALEALPEESQKHLREQLREVIVENGPWTPADAGSDYPYVPSEQAEKNGTLAKREQLAWGEMVSEYHEREEAIHSNARRSQAATAQLSGMSSKGGGNAGQNPEQNPGQSQNPSQNQQGQGESAEESAANDSGKEERAEALAQMLNASENSDSGASAAPVQSVETGTEQNALQLLTSRNQVPAQTAQNSGETRSQSPDSELQNSQMQDSEEQDKKVQAGQDLSLDLNAEDVIAIDDLDKVIVDPREFEDNQD